MANKALPCTETTGVFALETVVALASRVGEAMAADIRADAAKKLFEAFIILIDDRIRRKKETMEEEKKGAISESVEVKEITR